MAQFGYSSGIGSRIAYSTGKDSRIAQHAKDQVSLCELLDRVLNKGAVLTGEIVISVANIELLYVGINLLISSVETLLEAMDRPGTELEQTYESP